MKKLLLSLAVMAFGLSAMAEDPIASIKFAKSSDDYGSCNAYNTEWSSTDGMWKFSGFNNNNKGWDFIAAGWKTADTTPYVASGVSCPLPVSSIVFNIGDRLTSTALSSIKLIVADDAEFGKNVTETTLTAPTAKNSEWIVNVPNPAANKYYKVLFEIPKQTANGQAISLTKIALYQNPYQADAPKPAEYTKVNSIAEIKALATNTKVEVNFPMTVAFLNYSNVYVCDAAGDFIQIYGSNTLKNNDIIPAGWKAEYEFYNNNTPELKPEALPASTTQGNFTPKAVEPDKITVDLVNSVILVKNVVLDAASPATKDNFTGKVGETTLNFRNNYTLASVEAGTYDITVLVTIYQNAPSLYVVNYEAVGSGVEEIVADDAEAVYYNLQGVKVAEPTNGLYIKVQGKKSTKVYINE